MAMHISHPKGSFPKEEIARLVVDLGYECVGIHQVKEHEKTVIRVYIDSLGGINIKDCERVSRQINTFLEEGNLDEGLERYFLEVSSPGVERPLFSLEDYSRFAGKKIQIFLSAKKRVKGLLVGASDETVTVVPEGEDQETVLPFGDIERGHLLFDFEVKQFAHKSKKRSKKKKGKR